MTMEETIPTTAELWALLQEQRKSMDDQAAEVAQLKQKAAEVDGLKAANDRMQAELERQRLEKVSLASRLAEVEGGHSPNDRKLSRAGLLKVAAAGAAGLAAGVLTRPEEAAASSGTMLYGTGNREDTGTALIADNPTGGTFSSDSIFTAFLGTATGNFDGVRGIGSGSGSGVVGTTPGSDAGYDLAAGVVGIGNDGLGVYASSKVASGIYGKGALYGGYFVGDTASVHLNPAPGPGGVPPTLAIQNYDVGDIWVSENVTVWVCTTYGRPGTWVPLMHGNSNNGTNDALLTKASTQQYTLTNSDGTTWMDLDATNLSLSITRQQNSLAIISGNSDLWTSQAGYNQDLGLFISGGIYPTTASQPEAWKESGGFAGTFSPNAAFVQTVQQLIAGTAYTIKLQWKTNKNAAGATIWAGAGPIGGKFSPTRLTVLLVPSP